MSSPPSSASISEVEELPSKPLSNAKSSKPSSPDRAIAFLVHSPDSVANNLPPDCDNKPLARQRRRRTSPDDQRILEEAFARNPRPSKEDRLEIISKVALGDKEVQIWFQNRRQSSRRKSKPLDASEIEARLSGSSSAPSSPIQRPIDVVEMPPVKDAEHNVAEGSESSHRVEVQKSLEKLEPSPAAEEARKELEEKSVDSSKVVKDVVEAETQITALASITSSQVQPPSTFQTEFDSSQGFPSASQEALFMSTSITKPTYLANRRSASFVRDHTKDIPSASQPVTDAERAPRLRKSGSYLRLSMSEDGQARVIDRSAPSPPRKDLNSGPPPNTEQAPTGSLRRSYSAAGLSDLFKSSTPQPASRTKVPRVSQAGRSRDSRAWEFWCDADARNSLATKAEQENSGSAADAIGLIRQSSKNALRPNSRKGNSPMVGAGSFSGLGNAGKPARHGLQRAKTTYGRLQDASENAKPPKKGTEEALSPSGDSDKENWDPDENTPAIGIAPRRRPLGGAAANPRRGRTVLGENAQIPSYATSLGGMMDSEKKRRAAPQKVDDEVAAFMGAGENETEDLDCVQSLLSLSKGNWR